MALLPLALTKSEIPTGKMDNDQCGFKILPNFSVCLIIFFVLYSVCNVASLYWKVDYKLVAVVL